MKKRTRYSPTIYQVVFLIRKAKKEGLTKVEAKTLNEWLDQDVKNLMLYNKLMAEDYSGRMGELLAKDVPGWYGEVTQRKATRRITRWVTFGSVAAAASLALYFLFTPKVVVEAEAAVSVVGDATEVIMLRTGGMSEELLVHADSVYAVSSLLKEVQTGDNISDRYAEPVIVSTPVGKTITMRLEDGSVVYLNSSSQISFYQDFDLESERRVSLDGEAFFEVARDVERPFIVENNGCEIKVLGTSFNVNGFDLRSKFKLGLATGQVELSIKEIGYSKVLTPGLELSYDKNLNEVAQRARNIHEIGLWRTGVYAFEDISIVDFAKDMEQMYPVRFVYEGPIPRYLFSGEISREESWEKALDKLELTNRVEFTIVGNEITVRSPGKRMLITN